MGREEDELASHQKLAELHNVAGREEMLKQIAAMGPSKNNYLDEETKLNRKIEIFGTDMSQVPCFRETFLYGLLSGFGAGVACFAITSKPLKAQSVGIYTLLGFITVYWCQCRYRFAKDRFEAQRLTKLMQLQAMWNGTDMAPPKETIKLQANLESPKDEEFFKAMDRSCKT